MDRRLGPLNPGDRFLKYEIRRLIGRGGHAYVYEAHDEFLNLQVAVKVIPGSADTGKDLGARARAEARVLVRIAHDNVVKVMDAGATDEGLVYLIMELLHGRDLRKTLHQFRRLTVIETLRAAQQIADGVAAAHRLRAVHRDLKPENVFIEPGEKFKVLDFGVAKVMGYGAPTTQRDLLHGTALYMSPEQLRGQGVTAQSDIFALGTMLYEMLHTHPVLLASGGSVPGLEELGKHIIQAVPPPLSELDGAIPTYVARLVQRALAKKPEQRFATMEELSYAAGEALQRYVAEARAAGYEPQLRPLSGSVLPGGGAPPASDTDVMPPIFSSTSPQPSAYPTVPLNVENTVRLQPEPMLVAETRTRPQSPALVGQQTPSPMTSSASVTRRKARTMLWVGGALSLGLALGMGYELLLGPQQVARPEGGLEPLETGVPSAPAAIQIAPSAVPAPPEPAPKPAPAPLVSVAPAPEPPAPAAAAATTAVAVAKPRPAAPKAKASAKPAKVSTDVIDTSKLPSSGLDD